MAQRDRNSQEASWIRRKTYRRRQLIRAHAQSGYHRLFKRAFSVARDQSGDPIVEVASNTRPVLMRVSLNRISQYWLSVSYGDTTHNPFTRSCIELLREPAIPFEASLLARYYAAWAPTSVAQVFGLYVGPESPLNRSPLPADLIPWGSYRSICELDRAEVLQESRLARKFGIDGMPHGKRDFGPVSSIAGSSYHAEFRSVLDGITEHGYIPGLNGYPRVQVLTDGNSWAARALNGNHRLAALAALGEKEAAVIVDSQIVFRDQFPTWAGVETGLFTAGQALTVFDSFLKITPPSGFPLEL